MGFAKFQTLYLRGRRRKELKLRLSSSKFQVRLCVSYRVVIVIYFCSPNRGWKMEKLRVLMSVRVSASYLIMNVRR